MKHKHNANGLKSFHFLMSPSLTQALRTASLQRFSYTDFSGHADCQRKEIADRLRKGSQQPVIDASKIPGPKTSGKRPSRMGDSQNVIQNNLSTMIIETNPNKSAYVACF